MERENFVFYRSFFESIQEINGLKEEYDLPQEKINEIKLECYEAICEYALNNVEIDLKSANSRMIFRQFKPQIEANIKRYLNGCRPKVKQSKSKTKAKTKRSSSKSKANDNDNVNDNVNDNDNVNEKEKKVKHTHGTYKHVRLTDDEYSRLQNDFPYYQKLITKLDEYIEETGKKYKNHNLVLRRWVLDWYKENYQDEDEAYGFDDNEYCQKSITKEDEERINDLIEELRSDGKI